MDTRASYPFPYRHLCYSHRFVFGDRVFVRRGGRLVDETTGKPLEIVADGKTLCFRMPS